MGGINFGGRVKKYRKMGGLQCLPPSLWETLLHSDRKNCRVGKYLRTYEKTVLEGDWGIPPPPLTKKLACIPMLSTILLPKC